MSVVLVELPCFHIVRNWVCNMRFSEEKNILPSYPRTQHLPYNPNASRNDLVASDRDASIVLVDQVHIEEKIDGSSVGIAYYDKNPLIRNRDHILSKNYQKDTTAKKQFVPLWNYFYKNKERFVNLSELGPYSVYGEWCLVQHGIEYKRLPDYFIAYDIYNYEKKFFIPPHIAREILENLGFSLSPKLFSGNIDSYEEIAALITQSKFTDDLAEGLYLKTWNSTQVTSRFKMVRQDFNSNALWDNKVMKKNIVVKT